MGTMVRSAWVLISLAALGSAPLAAQRPITVTGARALNFGGVFPGVPRTVVRTDPVNSGRFDLRGARNAPVQLSFSLPATLLGPAGATLPIAFGSSDAGYSRSQAITSQVGFDPALPFVGLLSRRGRGSVFLGATANPVPLQPAGSYAATVTLTVAYVP